MASNHHPGRPLNGDENRGSVITAFNTSMFSFCTIVVALRIAVRLFVIKIKLWWDDWFIILASIGTFVGVVNGRIEVHYGFGRHAYFLSPHERRMFLLFNYIEWTQTFFTLMCTKVSICFFLMRIPVSRRHIVPLKICIAALVVSNIILTFLWLFQCWPVHSVWDATVQPQRCFNRHQIFGIILTQAIISIISDFALAFYPIFIIWNLRMRLKEKVGLCILMAFGIFTGSCAIVRTVLNWQAVSEDFSYGGIVNWFWRLFEVKFGIVCACVPALVPGYKWLKRRYFAAPQARSDDDSTGELNRRDTIRKERQSKGGIMSIYRSAQIAPRNRPRAAEVVIFTPDVTNVSRARSSENFDHEYTRRGSLALHLENGDQGEISSHPRLSIDIEVEANMQCIDDEINSTVAVER